MEHQNYFKKQREAILNDRQRKALLKVLFELYAKSMPMVLKMNDGTIVCHYSDEVEELANKIRDQIHERDNQVFKEHSS